MLTKPLSIYYYLIYFLIHLLKPNIEKMFCFREKLLSDGEKLLKYVQGTFSWSVCLELIEITNDNFVLFYVSLGHVITEHLSVS